MVHQNVARRPRGNVDLHKRYSSTRWSFYDVGLGACGKTNVNSDFIVALNSEQFGSGYPGTHCFKPITLTYKGKTATATIMDSCPGCPYGGLDLSRGLFKYFASEDEGIIYGDWSFADSAQEAITTSKHTVAAVTISAPNATLPTIIAAAGATPSANTTSTGSKNAPGTSATPENVSPSAIKVRPSASIVPQASTNASASANETANATAASSPPSTASSPSTTSSPSLTTSSPSTTSASSTASASPSTTTSPFTTSSFNVNPTTTSSSVISSSTAANYTSSIAAAKSSVANIASSLSSVAPSPTGSAGAALNATNANTTALIEDHLEAIIILLADLEKMIAAAGLGRDQD
uniref:Uncharacterized protein n=1 Tax=Psilocybe cubensis TaxID=181762 RepID=A0A8H7Y0E9_PSICU